MPHGDAKFNSPALFSRSLPLSTSCLCCHFLPCSSHKTGLLPLRQTPSRSQVELPVTMWQPLETDGLQTACHVYCCCHKRQDTLNTLPQEPHRIAQGPANSCLGGSIGPAHAYTPWTDSYLRHNINASITQQTFAHTYMPTHKPSIGAHSKCPPPTRPDMLHLLQLNKHAIWIFDDTLQPAPRALNIMVSLWSAGKIVHVTVNEGNLHCYLN